MVNRRLSHSLYSVKAAMFFGSPEHLTYLRYEILSPQRRYVILDRTQTLYVMSHVASLSPKLVSISDV